MTGSISKRIELGQTEKNKMLQILPDLKGKKVLVIGDVGLDEYVLGEVRRISPEAPVPVLEVSEEDKRLGLAANVAQNIVSLGGEALLISVVGDDMGAQLLKELAHKAGFSWDHMVVTQERPTTRKTRVMAKHHHLVRVDYEVKKFLSEQVEAAVIKKIESLAPASDVIVIEDYAKGVITQNMIRKIVEVGTRLGKRVLLDPHRDKAGEFYYGIDLIKPNYDEAVALSGLKFDELKENPNKILEVGRALQKKTGAKEVVLTRGKDGMSIFSGDQITEVPTYARKVFDVTGAGDTVIAALALGLAANKSLVDSCMLANFAAGVVVGKVGCVPCEIPELIDYINTTH
ncbi:MAG: D-glycero-beta-D-manno-heptose-7-phosphate kinase [Bdellovibrionia bacterium]